ncbi:MAG TPA: DUF86 domain-containing protein [Longimicrobium sp.]
MSRDWLAFLDDMVRSLEHVERFCAGIAEQDFHQDLRTLYAVQRAFEIVGEAAKHIPPDVRARHPEIDWRRVAGFRDVLSHAYFRVDPALVWDTAVNQAPPLRAQLTRALRVESAREDSES